MNRKMIQVVDRCRRSIIFFCENFCKVKHPSAGILPFRLFSYQKKSLNMFFKHRFTIYRKSRQCGISTLAGMYALWMTMFFKNRTVLITSKRDLDAKEFLYRNVRFVYQNLPEWLQDVFRADPDSAHEFGIARTGSKIVSLPGGPNTLRANSSSLNIIDEAAFTPHMEEMWAAGSPTLIHGGRCLVISTPNGIGDWYWSTWMDAKVGQNNFNPIEVMWWDMDWAIEYHDQITGQPIRIAPRDGIRKTTKEEKEIYGPYWSPWLEEQYRALRSRNEAHLFPQEILAEFLGSGNTVIPTDQIKGLEEQVKQAPKPQIIGMVPYRNEAAGISTDLHFMNDLWVWKRPIKNDIGKITIKGIPPAMGHRYVIGVDPSTGERTDFSAIEVFDVDEMEQVLELMTKVDAVMLAMMADYIGKWYNMGTMVVERIGYGMAVVQELRDRLQYPNLWKHDQPGKRSADYGFRTTSSTKVLLNKALIQHLGNYKIYSHRLLKQVTTYINLTGRKFGAVSGNNDDLVIAAGLALLAVTSTLGEPVTVFQPGDEPKMGEQEMQKILQTAGPRAVGLVAAGGDPAITPQEDELEAFTKQLIAPKKR